MSLETREINTTEIIHLVDSSSMADYCRNVMLFFASLVLASTFIQEVSAQDVSKVAPVSADPTLQPWLAQVTGKSVNVRTGPSTNHFAFSRLTMDTPVIAMGGKGDWVEILVPSDVPLWIHGDFVEETADQNLRVSGSRVRLRCAANTKYTPIGLTEAGQILRPTGNRSEDLKWVEIYSPLNAKAWIHGDYVKRTDQAIDISRLSTLHGTLKSKPGSLQGNPMTAGANADSESTSTTGAADNADPVNDKSVNDKSVAGLNEAGVQQDDGLIKIPTFESDRLKQLFEQFQKETEKPPVKWDFSDIFRKITVFETTSEDLGEIRVVKDLARTINEHFVPLQRRLIEIERQQELARAKREKEQVREKEILRRTGHRNTPGDQKYQAVGWVAPLGKHRKVEASHKLMKGNQLLYYLNGEKLNLDQYVNKRVGIIGTIQELDPETGARLLMVQKIEVLSR